MRRRHMMPGSHLHPLAETLFHANPATKEYQNYPPFQMVIRALGIIKVNIIYIMRHK